MGMNLLAVLILLGVQISESQAAWYFFSSAGNPAISTGNVSTGSLLVGICNGELKVNTANSLAPSFNNACATNWNPVNFHSISSLQVETGPMTGSFMPQRYTLTGSANGGSMMIANNTNATQSVFDLQVNQQISACLDRIANPRPNSQPYLEFRVSNGSVFYVHCELYR